MLYDYLAQAKQTSVNDNRPLMRQQCTRHLCTADAQTTTGAPLDDYFLITINIFQITRLVLGEKRVRAVRVQRLSAFQPHY